MVVVTVLSLSSLSSLKSIDGVEVVKFSFCLGSTKGLPAVPTDLVKL